MQALTCIYLCKVAPHDTDFVDRVPALGAARVSPLIQFMT
jgi:hypothetical protein